MADTANLDGGQLTEAQQVALQTYTSVTNQELSAAIPLLQRCQWNVQVELQAKVFCYTGTQLLTRRCLDCHIQVL